MRPREISFGLKTMPYIGEIALEKWVCNAESAPILRVFSPHFHPAGLAYLVSIVSNSCWPLSSGQNARQDVTSTTTPSAPTSARFSTAITVSLEPGRANTALVIPKMSLRLNVLVSENRQVVIFVRNYTYPHHQLQHACI